MDVNINAETYMNKTKSKDIEATTFNMWSHLKEKAKIYVAAHNRKVQKEGQGEKINLGLLINQALDYYLEDVKVR
jgi:hypothetical protein